MQSEIKKILLEIFTRRQDELEAELKTAIFNSEDFYHIAMLYAIADVSETTRSIVEPWLRGLAAASRGLGGKGSEQLINLLYPARSQQYLFPLPIFDKSSNDQEGVKDEAKPKKRFKIF